MQFHNVCCYGKLRCVWWGRGGRGEESRGEEGKAPIKKFMLLVLHLPIACADAAGEYLRQTAYLSAHNGAIRAPFHHILLPTTTVNRTNAHTLQQISYNAHPWHWCGDKMIYASHRAELVAFSILSSFFRLLFSGFRFSCFDLTSQPTSCISGQGW